MYAQYYLQARDVADRISEGSYSGPIKQQSTGFTSRPESGTMAGLAKADADKASSDEMVLQYMLDVRKNMKAPHITQTGGSQIQAVEALGQIESGGNWEAVGPVVTKGAYEGQRAIGKFQVMEGNIAPWTKRHYGKALTTEEFKSNHAAQKAVAEGQMKAAYEKYGSWEDAASVWFSGGPVKDRMDATDGYNTVPQYIEKFRKAMK